MDFIAILIFFLTFLKYVYGISLWIDANQVNEFYGIPIGDIYVIKDGQVSYFLLSPDIEQKLPEIPSDVHLVNLTWEAKGEKYRYWFAELTSMQEELMYNPLLSIPASGAVPNKKTVFQIAIPCTGRKTGIAPFLIVLHILDKYGRSLEGSPIKLHFRKECNAFDRKLCDQKCMNGGICDSKGMCKCVAGFYGKYCENALCNPHCMNEGTCETPGVCVCSPGYRGKYCEEAICTEDCYNGGKCIAPNKCWCPPGFHGNQCWFQSCPRNCENGGHCAGNRCICPDGFTGQFCQIAMCRKSCGLHGKCVAVEKCQCMLGWHGRHCNRTYTYGIHIKGKGKKNDRKRRAKEREREERRKERERKRRRKRTHKKNNLVLKQKSN